MKKWISITSSKIGGWCVGILCIIVSLILYRAIKHQVDDTIRKEPWFEGLK